MTRVLIDARLPWGSGIGRYVRNIVPLVVTELGTVDFTLLVASDDHDRAVAAIEGATNVVVQCDANPSFSLREQAALPALATSHDLTWFTNYWVPLRWPGRFVVTVHDLMHLDPLFPASRLRRFAAARTFAKVRRDAAHVIFVSRFTARSFTSRLGAPRAASVVHHGIDHVGARPLHEMSPSPLTRQKFALVVAAAKEHKNLGLLLDAWHRADLVDWRLVLVTPDDRLRSSIDLDVWAKQSCNVEIRRGIDDATLSTLYAQAGFVLVPSRYEGFGLPLLEAMDAGAPVISSTADALVEVASGALIPFVSANDREGWTFAISQMAKRCGPSNDWQAGISARNVAIAREFTWKRAAGLTARIIKDALPDRR